MSRITEIMELVAKTSTNLEDALLQCMLLGSQLEHEPLQSLSELETGGYKTRISLPDYRMVRTTIRGMYFHPGYQPYRRTVPEFLIPEEHRADVQKIYFYDNIGTLNALADDGTLSNPVPGSDYILSRINEKMQSISDNEYEYFEQITCPIPPGAVAGVLTAIRQRILRFMIDMNKLFPDDQAIVEQGPKKTQEITNLFQTIFHINAQNVSIARDNATVNQGNLSVTQVNTGDWQSLEDFLSDYGVPDEQIESLRPLLDRVGNGDVSDETKGELAEWMAEAAETVYEAGGEVAKEVIVQTLSDAVGNYLPEMISQGFYLAQILLTVFKMITGN